MKKILILTLTLICFITTQFVYASTDKTSEAYLKNKHHFAIMNPIAECIAQNVIKNQIKKETGAKFNVKLDGYTLYSLKKGIFKNLEIDATKVNINDIFVHYIQLKTISEYNWIDYTQNPPIFKSDMTFAYEIDLTEESLNNALQAKEYKNVINNVNHLAYPLFAIQNLTTEIKNNRIYMIIEYTLPLRFSQKPKRISISSEFHVVNGLIQAKNVDSNNKKMISKITNLINLLNPLSFTLDLLENKKCNCKIENIKIIDNIIKINGKIFVKGD